MSRGLPVASASQAYLNARVLGFAFTVAPVMYIVMGEVLRFSANDFAPDGFNNFGEAIWAARAAVFAWVVVSSIVAHRVITDERFVQSALAKEESASDATVYAALTAATVVRYAFVESVAILGVLLYVNNADRIDYIFPLITVLNMFLLRPNRDRWEAAFRQASLQHPGVSSLPW